MTDELIHRARRADELRELGLALARRYARDGTPFMVLGADDLLALSGVSAYGQKAVRESRYGAAEASDDVYALMVKWRKDHKGGCDGRPYG